MQCNFFTPKKNLTLAHKPLWLLHHFSPAQLRRRAYTLLSMCSLPFSPEHASAKLCPMNTTNAKVPSDLHGLHLTLNS